MRNPRTVAVVAHRRKTLGGGLDELRRRITDQGVDNLLWYEVPKSRKAPKKVKEAVKAGVDLLMVWGGDGMVQRSIDVLAREKGGGKIPLAILPAGTGNLLARAILSRPPSKPGQSHEAICPIYIPILRGGAAALPPHQNHKNRTPSPSRGGGRGRGGTSGPGLLVAIRILPQQIDVLPAKLLRLENARAFAQFVPRLDGQDPVP
jgi:hypothetical protein